MNFGLILAVVVAVKKLRRGGSVLICNSLKITTLTRSFEGDYITMFMDLERQWR